ncbi:MAG TPA: TVP38/TMEM64 family protein [Thermoanaerobaculia bacterium]|nr:TVP38/TMEM64 family protein [Thermoanaerobaculia bacterium]
MSPAAKRVLTVLAVVSILALVGWLSARAGWLDLRRIPDWLASIGGVWWAPLAFILLYTAFNVLLLPATILTLSAGVIWGWQVGGLWVLAASTVGSFVPFLIGRSGARGLLSRRGGRWERLQDLLKREGFVTLLLLRLVPLFPYNVLNYAAGLAGVPPRDYVAATALGTIPGIFIFTYLADAIAAGLSSPRDAFGRVLLAGLLLAVLVMGTRLVSRRVQRRVER